MAQSGPDCRNVECVLSDYLPRQAVMDQRSGGFISVRITDAQLSASFGCDQNQHGAVPFEGAVRLNRFGGNYVSGDSQVFYRNFPARAHDGLRIESAGATEGLPGDSYLDVNVILSESRTNIR